MQPIQLLLSLELRGQRRTERHWFAIDLSAPEDATLESLRPFVLEKTIETFGTVYQKRTTLRMTQYDPQERRALLEHSLVASKGDDFIHELTWGHGWMAVPGPK